MANQAYDYTTPGDYTYDSDKIDITAGVVSVKEDLSNVYARWHLNESSGTSVADDSGNSRTATAVNTEDGDWVSGKLNNCISLDGVDEYINCGNIAGFERTDSFSIEAWINTTDDSQNIVGKRNDGAPFRGYELQMLSGKIYFLLCNDSAGGNVLQVYTTTVTVNDGAWHHVVATYDGTSDAYGINVYIDNSLVSLTVQLNALSATIQNSENFNIGARRGINKFFNGLIDEVVIYDKELSSSEVAYRYNSGSGIETFLNYSDNPTIEPTSLFNPASVATWDSFSETLGGGNEGSIGYNLYKVNKTNQYYWNGAAWVTGGSSSNYNTAATINTNIGTFDATPDEIGYIAYLISNGSQDIELSANTIGYTDNVSPSVNAGLDKTADDNETISPFSDCTFSDADGTVTNSYYKIIGEVDIYTEISQGGYGTLLEAVQAFTYKFENTGSLTCWLKVKDNGGAESEDSLTVTVSAYTVTFNVKDSQATHLANISFNPGDGSGWTTKNSPFTHDYEYSATDISAIFDKPGYSIETITFATTTHTESVTLNAMVSASDVANAVWDEAIADHRLSGSFGLALQKTLGLAQHNYRIFSPVYDGNNNLTSATIKIYPTSTDTTNDTNELEEYTLTASYTGNELTTYKLVEA